VVVLRCTQTLLLCVRPTVLAEGISSTMLGDWYGTLIGVKHTRVLLFVSEHGRLPVVLPARTAGNLPQTFPPAVDRVLRAVGVDESVRRRELHAMADIRLATTNNNRSLLATMTDYAHHLKWRLRHQPASELFMVTLELCGMPVGPLGYRMPGDVTRDFLG